MARTIQDRIAAKFPRLYHYGPADNHHQIERFQAIFSSGQIRIFAGLHHPSAKRQTRELVETPMGNFILNDQQALKYGHVKHLDSLTESEFVALLDQFAFFWPGTENSPSEMGRNFAARYQRRGDSLVQIVAATRSLMRLNRAGRIFISQCNSGAPRSNPYKAIYRGKDTFIPIMKYESPICEIKEIAIQGWAILPADSQIVLLRNASSIGLSEEL